MRSRFTQLAKGLIRKRGQRNKNEAAYEVYLDSLKGSGSIADYWFEPFSLRLSEADSGVALRYTPDFMILAEDGTIYVDDIKAAKTKKGVAFDDPAAIIRIKAAADRYPLFVFRLVRSDRKGGWEFKEI